MKAKDTTINIEDTRLLLGKYFDATISPLEMRRLESIANDVNTGNRQCPDIDVAVSLEFISTFGEYAEASLDTPECSMPAGLEDRLNSHISMLAATQHERKRKSPFPKVIAIATAAAAVAAIAIGGIGFMSDSNAFDTPHQILIADASSSDSVSPIPEPIPALPESGISPHVSVVNTLNSISSNRHKEKNKRLKAKSGNLIAANRQPATTDRQPFSISAETFKVMPSGITASIDPAQILVQPISTLSQSINNIYESVETVSEALSGVSSSLKAVSNSLALLSEPL